MISWRPPPPWMGRLLSLWRGVVLPHPAAVEVISDTKGCRLGEDAAEDRLHGAVATRVLLPVELLGPVLCVGWEPTVHDYQRPPGPLGLKPSRTPLVETPEPNGVFVAQVP